MSDDNKVYGVRKFLSESVRSMVEQEATNRKTSVDAVLAGIVEWAFGQDSFDTADIQATVSRRGRKPLSADQKAAKLTSGLDTATLAALIRMANDLKSA